MQGVGHKPFSLGFRPFPPCLLCIWSYENIEFSLVPSCGKMQYRGLKGFTGRARAAIGKEDFTEGHSEITWDIPCVGRVGHRVSGII